MPLLAICSVALFTLSKFLLYQSLLYTTVISMYTFFIWNKTWAEKNVCYNLVHYIINFYSRQKICIILCSQTKYCE